MVGDEATSALDSHTEAEIMAALDAAATGRTYIVIAHRLSTITDSDSIAVLQDGVVAELGSFDELLAADGIFARMWAKHAASERDKGELQALPPAGADQQSSVRGAVAPVVVTWRKAQTPAGQTYYYSIPLGETSWRQPEGVITEE
jgi:ABC-type multidrug transport system ATPase subunit